MTAGTSNGLAMIRRAIPRPRSSILLEVAKETLHPSALLQSMYRWSNSRSKSPCGRVRPAIHLGPSQAQN